MSQLNVCAHPDCENMHDNGDYCCRLHQRLGVLGLSIPEGATTCQGCGDAWADGPDNLCGKCRGTSREDTMEYTKRRTEELSDGEQLHEAHTDHAMSDEEMVDFFNIDREAWEVITSNRWYNGSVWCHQMKTKPRGEARLTKQIVQETLDGLRKKAPIGTDPDYPDLSAADRRYAVELMMPDQHASMYAYAPETRGEHWDTDIFAHFHRHGIRELVDRIRRLPGEIEKFIYPIGNDLVHVDQWAGDRSGGATAAGTIQDVDTRRQRAYRVIRSVLEEGIMYMREIAPVEVIVVPGNHGPFAEFTLGEVLDARFHNDHHVVVKNPDSQREYVQHGCVMLGFAHGDDVAKSRIPMLMPIEDKEKWAATTHREMHLGHAHHLDQRGFAMEAEEDVTIRIRRCPTIVPRDAWHAAKGFKHVRAVEAYLWSAEYGFEGLLNSTPRSIEDYAEAS